MVYHNLIKICVCASEASLLKASCHQVMRDRKGQAGRPYLVSSSPAKSIGIDISVWDAGCESWKAGIDKTVRVPNNHDVRGGYPMIVGPNTAHVPSSAAMPQHASKNDAARMACTTIAPSSACLVPCRAFLLFVHRSALSLPSYDCRKRMTTP